MSSNSQQSEAADAAAVDGHLLPGEAGNREDGGAPSSTVWLRAGDNMHALLWWKESNYGSPEGPATMFSSKFDLNDFLSCVYDLWTGGNIFFPRIIFPNELF